MGFRVAGKENGPAVVGLQKGSDLAAELKKNEKVRSSAGFLFLETEEVRLYANAR